MLLKDSHVTLPRSNQKAIRSFQTLKVHDDAYRASPGMEIVLVHGSSTPVTQKLEKSLVRSSAQIGKSLGDCRVHVFGYNAAKLLHKGKPRFEKLVQKLLADIRYIPKRRRVALVAHNSAAWLVREVVVRWQYDSALGGMPVGLVDFGLPAGVSEKDWSLEDWHSFREGLLAHLIKVSPKAKDYPMLDFSIIHSAALEFENLMNRLKAAASNLEIISICCSGKRKVSRSETQGSKESKSSTGSNENTEARFLSINYQEERDIVEFLKKISNNSPAPVPPVEGSSKSAQSNISLSGTAMAGQSSMCSVSDQHQSGSNVPNVSFNGQSAYRKPGNGSSSPRISSEEIPAILPQEAIWVPNLPYAEPHEQKTSRRISSSAFQKPSTDKPEEGGTITEPDDPETISGLAELKQNKKIASSFLQKGDLREASRLYYVMVAWCEKVELRDHGYFKMRLQQAQITYIRGDYISSEDNLAWLLGIQYKYDHDPNDLKELSFTCEIARWLALSQWRQGKYINAQKTLEGCHKRLPEESTNVPLFLSTLALVLASTGAFKFAWRLSSRAVRNWKKHGVINDQSPRPGGTPDDKDATQESDGPGQLSSCLFNHAQISCAVGRFQDAEKANQEALDDMKKRYGPRHFITLDAASLRAWLLVTDSRTTQAGEEVRRILRDMRERLGQDHPSTLKTLETLVLVYKSEGRYSDAEDTARYLLRKNEESENLGARHPQTLKCKTILAEILLACGKWEEAEETQRQVCEDANEIERTASQDAQRMQREVGKAEKALLPAAFFYRIALANILRARGKWDEARQEAVLVLIGQLNKFSNEEDGRTEYQTDSITAEPLSGEDFDMAKLGKLLRSSKYIRSVLRNLPQGLHDPLAGSEPVRVYPSLVHTLHCVALCEQVRDDANLAFVHGVLEYLHDIYFPWLGEKHRFTVNVEYDLAVNHRLRGNFKVSLDLIKDVAEKRLKSLGKDHPDYLMAKHQRAVTLFRLCRWKPALEEQRLTLKAQEFLLGKSHPDAILSRFTLSGIYHSLNRLQEADDLLHQVISDQTEIYNQENHPIVLRSRSRHALILLDKGSLNKTNFKRAQDEQVIVVNERSKTLGEDHSLTRSARNDLAQILQAAGEFAQAEKIYLELSEGRARQYAKKNPLEFQVRSNLASCYYEMKKYQAAANIQLEIYEESNRKKSPNEHGELLIASTFNLALTCKALNDFGQARILLDEAIAKAEDILGRGHPQTEELWATMRNWRQERDSINIKEDHEMSAKAKADGETLTPVPQDSVICDTTRL